MKHQRAKIEELFGFFSVFLLFAISSFISDPASHNECGEQK